MKQVGQVQLSLIDFQLDVAGKGTESIFRPASRTVISEMLIERNEQIHQKMINKTYK